MPNEVPRNRRAAVRDQRATTAPGLRGAAPQPRQLRALPIHVAVVDDQITVRARRPLQVHRPSPTLRRCAPTYRLRVAQHRPRIRPVLHRHRPTTSTGKGTAISTRPHPPAGLDGALHPRPGHARPPRPSHRRHHAAAYPVPGAPPFARIAPSTTIDPPTTTRTAPHHVNPLVAALPASTVLLWPVHTPKHRPCRSGDHTPIPEMTAPRPISRRHPTRVRHTPRVPSTRHVDGGAALDLCIAGEVDRQGAEG